MRTAYLHIGLEKTGTTSVQIFLRTNSDLLEKYNLEYLGHEKKPYVHGIAHFPIAASFYKECPWGGIPATSSPISRAAAASICTRSFIPRAARPRTTSRHGRPISHPTERPARRRTPTRCV